MNNRLGWFLLIAILAIGFSVNDTKFTIGNITLEDNSGELVVDANIITDGLEISGGTNLTNILTGSDTLDFTAFISKGATQDLTFTLTGAAVTDEVFLAFDRDVGTTSDEVRYKAWVSSTNTITVRGESASDGSPDPDPGLFQVLIIR